MKLDFRQLEAFCAVLDEGGFTAAAKALHLAQATVSERIANLEAAVGGSLLDRRGRKVVTTKVGDLLYQRAKELLRETQNVELEVEAFLGRWAGTLRVGASTVPGNQILPGLLVAFREAYPESRVEMTVGDSDRIGTLVSFGTLELGFVTAVPESSELDRATLWSDELVLVAPPGHPFCGRETVSLEDLAAEPLILREPSSGSRQRVEAALADAYDGGVDALRVGCVLGSPEAIKEGVMQGLGLAFLSSRAIQRERDAGLLCPLAVEGLSLTREVLLVSDPKVGRTPLGQALMDFVLSQFDG